MHPFRTSPSIDDFDPRRSLSVSRHVRTTRHCSHRLSDEWLVAGYRNRRARDITRLVGGEHDIGWSSPFGWAGRPRGVFWPNSFTASGGMVERISGVQTGRSEAPTSELQSPMRISYAVFCLKNIKTLLHYIQFIHHNTTTLCSASL